MPRKPNYVKNPSPSQAALIAELENTPGLSVNSWAKESGLSEGALRKIVTEEGAGVTIKTLERLASARKKTVRELLGYDPESGVRLVGKVGAGAAVYFFDGEDSLGEPVYIEPPPEIDIPEDYRALEIEGDSMHPLQHGWRAIFRKRHNGITADEIDQLCVVQLKDGRCLLKTLRRGRTEGLFDLESWNAPPLRDQDVEWASPVISISTRR